LALGALAMIVLAAGAAYWLTVRRHELQDPAALLPKVEAALQGFACAHLEARVERTNVEISGYVGTDDDGQALAARLAALAGNQVVNHAGLMKWPLCEALDILREQTISDPQTSVTPLIDPGGQAGLYHENDHFMISVTDRHIYKGESYLTIDYIDVAGGYIVHLLPNDIRSDNKAMPGDKIVIGALKEEADSYVAQPPFGTNMIVAISTPEPLFSELRPRADRDMKQYLLALRQRLKALAVDYGASLYGSYSMVALTQ
jgi:hypothetical protein